jgi:hypothetical protein
MLRLALVVVALSVSSAWADGWYYSLGLGGTRVHDELSAYTPDAFRLREALGMRRGQWAYEVWFAGNFSNDLSASQPDLISGGVDLKYIQPLSRHLEVYLRGGAMVGSADNKLDGWEGRGLGVGAGIQLKGKGSVLGLLWWPLFFCHVGPKMTAALWLDSGYEFYRLHGDKPTAIDAQLSTLTAGVAVGTDF